MSDDYHYTREHVDCPLSYYGDLAPQPSRLTSIGNCGNCHMVKSFSISATASSTYSSSLSSVAAPVLSIHPHANNPPIDMFCAEAFSRAALSPASPAKPAMISTAAAKLIPSSPSYSEASTPSGGDDDDDNNNDADITAILSTPKGMDILKNVGYNRYRTNQPLDSPENDALLLLPPPLAPPPPPPPRLTGALEVDTSSIIPKASTVAYTETKEEAQTDIDDNSEYISSSSIKDTVSYEFIDMDRLFYGKRKTGATSKLFVITGPPGTDYDNILVKLRRTGFPANNTRYVDINAIIKSSDEGQKRTARTTTEQKRWRVVCADVANIIRGILQSTEREQVIVYGDIIVRQKVPRNISAWESYPVFNINFMRTLDQMYSIKTKIVAIKATIKDIRNHTTLGCGLRSHSLREQALLIAMYQQTNEHEAMFYGHDLINYCEIYGVCREFIPKKTAALTA